jgi:hypothetical protein
MERSIVLVGKGEGGSPCPAGSSLSAHLPAAKAGVPARGLVVVRSLAGREGGSPCPAGSSLSAHLPAARPGRLASLSGVTVPPGCTTARERWTASKSRTACLYKLNEIGFACLKCGIRNQTR